MPYPENNIVCRSASFSGVLVNKTSERSLQNRRIPTSQPPGAIPPGDNFLEVRRAGGRRSKTPPL